MKRGKKEINTPISNKIKSLSYIAKVKVWFVGMLIKCMSKSVCAVYKCAVCAGQGYVGVWMLDVTLST